VASFLAQPGRRTITGMLVGARLAGRWHHARAHRFYAAARWSPDALGLLLVDLIATRLLDRQAPLHLVVDDTLFRRSGRKVWGAAWHHDPLAGGRRQVAWATAGSCSGCWFVCVAGLAGGLQPGQRVAHRPRVVAQQHPLDVVAGERHDQSRATRSR
jgi:DDE superfamily endonuclease